MFHTDERLLLIYQAEEDLYCPGAPVAPRFHLNYIISPKAVNRFLCTKSRFVIQYRVEVQYLFQNIT